MEKKVTMETLISKINESNAATIIKFVFDDVMEKNENGENLLHLAVNEIHSYENCLCCIKSLLRLGVDPNHLDNDGYNFVQKAIKTGYSSDFIVKCIEAALKYDFNVNNKDNNGNTIGHTALLEEKYLSGIDMMLILLVKNGYNPTSTNKDGLSLDDILYRSKKYSLQQKRTLNYDISDTVSFYLRQQNKRSNKR